MPLADLIKELHNTHAIDDLLREVGLAQQAGTRLHEVVGERLTYYFKHEDKDSSDDPIEAVTVVVEFAHYRAKEGSITLLIEPITTSKGFQIKDRLITITKEGAKAEFEQGVNTTKQVYGVFGTPPTNGM